jgi:hypothetical protein
MAWVLVAPAMAQAAMADVTISLKYIGVGVGIFGGNATVTMNGKSVQYKVSGAHLIGAGVSSYNGSGKVMGVKSPADWEGRFKVTRASLSVISGNTEFELVNDRGVTMQIAGESRGMDLSVGPGELKFTRE